MFVDTSALYALLDEDKDNHEQAASWLTGTGAAPDLTLTTSSYVVVETAALVQRRLGTEGVRTLVDAYLPAISTVFIDERLHRPAVAAWLATLRRRNSLVDHVSFEVMRDRGIGTAFAFDLDFVAAGFDTVPSAQG